MLKQKYLDTLTGLFAMVLKMNWKKFSGCKINFNCVMKMFNRYSVKDIVVEGI